MTQQTSPFLDVKYGWNYGESGWNTGMDENLVKFSFLFDRNIDAIVSSLPNAVSGQSYFLTSDNRLYFSIGGNWYSSPTPKWFEMNIKSTGQKYQFNGTGIVEVLSPSGVEASLDAIELRLSQLGTASNQSVEFFASKAQLDVAVSNAAAYTDTLKSSLANTTDLTKGISLVGGSVRSLETIAELRTLTKLGSKLAFVKRYETGKLGGGGYYYLDESDTTSADNGGTIIVNASDGGRWKLIWDKTLDIRNFGIDNTGATDVSARMNVMIAAAYNAGGARITGEGTLLINSTVLIYPGVQLQFKGRDSMRVISTVNNVTVFRTARPAGYVPVLALNCGVSGITFSLSGKYGGSTCLDISDAKDGKFDDILFANCSQGIWFNKYAAANGSQFFGQCYSNELSRLSFQVCSQGVTFQGASNENNFHGIVFGDCDDCFDVSRGDTNYSETNNFYGVRIEGCKNVVEPAVNRSQNYGWNFYGLVIENPTSNPFDCAFKDPSTWNVYGLTIVPADGTKVILYDYFPGFYSNIVGSKGSSDRRSVGIRLAEEVWAIRGIRYVGANVGTTTYSGSIGVGQTVPVTVNVSAARTGDAISVTEDKDLLGVSVSSKYVSASGVVTFRLTNGSGGAVTLTSVTFTAVCSKIGATGPVI